MIFVLLISLCITTTTRCTAAANERLELIFRLSLSAHFLLHLLSLQGQTFRSLYNVSGAHEIVSREREEKITEDDRETLRNMYQHFVFSSVILLLHYLYAQ